MAKGYNQTVGIGYHKTFSPLIKMVIVRTIIALVEDENWIIYQMDLYNAFLCNDLFEEVFMEKPNELPIQGD